jgi:hypothetical protein
MTLEKRIQVLLKTGEMESVALAGVLLQSIPGIERQIEVFKGACNKSIGAHPAYLTCEYLFITHWPGRDGCFNIIGKNWTLYYNGYLHMLKAPHNPGLYKEINI